MTDEEQAEAVVYGLADPQWRRIVSRGRVMFEIGEFECTLTCGHVVVVSDLDWYDIPTYDIKSLVCDRCTLAV